MIKKKKVMLIFCLGDDDVHVKSDFCVAFISEVIYPKVKYTQEYFKFCGLNAFSSEIQIYIYVHRDRYSGTKPPKILLSNSLLSFPSASGR